MRNTTVANCAYAIFRIFFRPLAVVGLSVFVYVCGPATRATTFVSWDSDTKSTISVRFGGALSDGFPGGHHTSPTCLWDFDLSFGSLMPDYGGIVFNTPGFMLSGNYNGSGSFDFSTPGGFADLYTSFGGAHSGDSIYIADEQYIGKGRISFFGIDFNDLSTWNYEFEFTIQNPNPIRVSDSGSTVLFASAALVLLASVRMWTIHPKR